LTVVTCGISDGSFLNCVREDPVRKGLLYACRGVYVSFNDGDDWQSLQLTADDFRRDRRSRDDPVVATFARLGFDNVTPLRNATRNCSGKPSFHKPRFACVPAMSKAPSPDGRTSLRIKSPDGAVLDYYLRETSGSGSTQS
jgi:hypothetical protein